MSIVIWLLTFVLVLLSVFLVLVVLAQKSKSDGGVGAALGGGMTEATFGADTGNILATMTRNGTIAFFVICFGLYLAHIAQNAAEKKDAVLPTIEVPAEAPAAVPAAATTTAIETAPAAADTTEAAPSISLPAMGTETAAPAASEPAK
ncbi:MAG: preprotein translocase subunit SecG [Opitutaceae bacterium]|jgi:preprotein translocase subunit SecG|nr:preprotein translocase subunit SecG [Opitutaceae bacterium]